MIRRRRLDRKARHAVGAETPGDLGQVGAGDPLLPETVAKAARMSCPIDTLRRRADLKYHEVEEE